VKLADGKWQTSVVWDNQRVLRTKFTNCVVRDGYVYGLSDGILECIDLATGKRQWKRGRYRQGQLLLVGEHLLISAEEGDLVLVEARHDEFVELARYPVIGDVTWNTLTLSGNRLLMRNSDEAACVRLPVVSTYIAEQKSSEDKNDQEVL
jgi:outer membrane protein assembly factor BamB